MTKTSQTPVTDRLIDRLIRQHGHGTKENAMQTLEICVYGDGYGRGYGQAWKLHTDMPRRPDIALNVAASLNYYKASTPARCASDAQALLQECAHW